MEQNLLQNSLQSQQQAQDILGAASQMMQQYEDTRMSWQQDVESLKDEYQAEAQQVQQRYVQQIEMERYKLNEFCARVNGEVRERGA